LAPHVVNVTDLGADALPEPETEGLREHARGASLAALLYDDLSWIHRRKDRIEILDDTWIRRQTSVDFVVPASAPSVGTALDGQKLFEVPLGLLPISPLGFAEFDVVDEKGRRVALSTFEENQSRNVCVLKYAAGAALAVNPGEPLNRDVEDLITAVGASPSAIVSGTALRKIVRPGRQRAAQNASLEALRQDQRFMWLMAALVDNSIVAVAVPGSADQRQVLKFSYYERRLNRPDAEYRRLAKSGLHPYPLIVEAPYIAASSYHMEILAPTGLEIVDTFSAEFSYAEAAELPERLDPIPRPEPWALTDEEVRAGRRGSRSHIYVSDATDADRIEARILLRVEREGFVAAAAWTSLMILVILAIYRIDLANILHRSPIVPSVLLIFPGLVATVSGRARDHRLTIRMLSTARRGLLLSAGCAFAPAVGLSLSTFGDGHKPTGLLITVWWVCIGLAAFSAITLQLARFLPRQGQLTASGKPNGLRYRLLELLGLPFALVLDPRAVFRKRP
jgi:hypothetical protein